MNPESNYNNIFFQQQQQQQQQQQFSSNNNDPNANLPPSKRLWVGNLAPQVSEEHLRDEFIAYGPIEDIRILQNKYCAFITYVDTSMAISAKNALRGKLIGDRNIKINFVKVRIRLVRVRRRKINTRSYIFISLGSILSTL